MKSISQSSDSRRALSGALASLSVLFVCGSVAGARGEIKTPRPLPHMTDVKSTEPAPVAPATAGPERFISSETGHALVKPAKAVTVGGSDTPQIDFSKVVIDQPTKGDTWVRGRTYKASFDANGATYIPFLGSNAPHNFPVRVELESMRIGGFDIELSTLGVSHSGDEITIDRGVLREVWRVSTDQAEQSFVLAAAPDSAGPLELRIALDSELEANAAADGIELVGEFGGVMIGHTVVVDAAGVRTEIESRLQDGEMVLDIPAEVLARAQYPLVVDPVYSTNALDTTTTATALPDVCNAGTAGNWAASYQFSFSATDADVWTLDVFYGTPVANSGVWVDYTGSSWISPRIAYNALNNTFLTVCSVRPTQNAPGEIWCRARTAGTITQFNQVLIQSSILGSCFYPDVGGDPVLTGPTYFMVVWTRNFSANDWDVHGRLVGYDGTPQGTSPIFIAGTTAFDWYPRISKTDGRAPYSTQEWNVVWMRGNGVSDVWGAQIHWDGAITTPAFPIDQTVYADTFPSASSLLDGTSGPRPWLVTYRRQFTNEGDVYAKALVGSSILTELNLSVAENADPYEDQLDPDVDSNGQRFAIAYSESYNNSTTDRDLYVTTVHLSGNAISVDEAHNQVDYDTLDTTGAQISCGMTEAAIGFPYYAMAWPRYGGGVEDTYVGAYYEPVSYDTFCYGDGSAGACPCGTSGFRGCPNSATNGAALFLQGNNYTSADTFSIFAFNLPPGSIGLFFQGTSASTTGSAFGDGLLCMSGSIARLGVKTAPIGNATYPEVGDLSISVKGNVPSDGGYRYYQMWYRDAASYCTAATFNITSAARVLWLR